MLGGISARVCLAVHATDLLIDAGDHAGLVFALAAAHLIIATGNSTSCVLALESAMRHAAVVRAVFFLRATAYLPGALVDVVPAMPLLHMLCKLSVLPQEQQAAVVA